MCRVAFSTTLGPLGLRWTRDGVREVVWPENLDGPPWPAVAPWMPRWLSGAARSLRRHLRTGREDLSRVPVTLEGLSPFAVAVLLEVRHIPPGSTRTYGEVAAALGRPGAGRAVGRVLARNPLPLLIPCHRVVSRRDGLGGFTAPWGLDRKRWLLELEKSGPGESPIGEG